MEARRMSKFLVSKQLGSLRPIDEEGELALRKLGQGEIVVIELKRPRNIKFHRLYFALINLVWQNLDEERYPTPSDLHAAIKIAAGLRTRIELPDGTLGFIPGSIAFHKMSEDDFSAFYNRVCDLISKHFLPGVKSQDLKHEVELMIEASHA